MNWPTFITSVISAVGEREIVLLTNLVENTQIPTRPRLTYCGPSIGLDKEVQFILCLALVVGWMVYFLKKLDFAKQESSAS
jgi:hypothetical protein